MIKERDLERQKFYESLAESVDEPIDGIDWGPIQAVFKENLKESLLKYQGHLEHLRKQKETLNQ